MSERTESLGAPETAAATPATLCGVTLPPAFYDYFELEEKKASA